jgi:hypothetical protein
VHSIVTDSKGNIFTTETYRGQRVQKFIYKGLVPLSTLIAAEGRGRQHHQSLTGRLTFHKKVRRRFSGLRRTAFTGSGRLDGDPHRRPEFHAHSSSVHVQPLYSGAQTMGGAEDAQVQDTFRGQRCADAVCGVRVVGRCALV